MSPLSSFTIKASVQPLSANELQTLDEGRRSQTVYRLISKTPLTSVVINEQNPDLVRIGNVDFEVFQCDPWQNGLCNHYSILVSKAVQ
jgi:hypothetical protein